MAKRQLRIDVLGTSFVIQSDESADHLARLSSYVKAKVEEVKSRYSFAEPLTVAVLAALNIADEMFKAKDGRESSGTADEIANAAERLISKIDEDLLEHIPYDMDANTRPSPDRETS
jgi:cell division protein ZapA